MNFLLALLEAVADPRLRYMAEVEERVRILEGPETEDRKAFQECNCPACISARQYIAHKNVVGKFDGTTSASCTCHNCISSTDGHPMRKMPHSKCRCEFCCEWRAAGKPNLDDDDNTVIVEDRTPQMTVVKVGVEDVIKRLVGGHLNEDIIDATSFPALPAAQSEEADASSTDSQSTENGTREDPAMANVNDQLIRDRKKMDISNKEPPRFETAGTTIVLPEGMSPIEGAEWLLKRERDMEQTVQINETIDGFPLDAAMALFKALNKEFGWTETGGIPTWFGEIPPSTISVAVGVNKFVNVPWGMINMPGIDGFIYPCAGHPAKDGHPVLTIHGEVKKKHRERIAKIAQDARNILREESIYKGQAIKVTFPDDAVNHGEEISTQDMPTFYDTSKVDPDEIVFSKSVEEQINVSLFTPIKHTQACRDAKIPLKRTVLFAGPYGVGKTLTAAVTAQLAPKHGWTFILIESAEDLERAVEFAKQYEPAIIFSEDIDSVMKGERTIDMDGVLNIVDGIESKGRELMIVLTTNHPEKINKAMMRPGRVDAYIEVTPPDADAAQRLVRVYARGLLVEGEDLTTVGDALKGHKPASIREVVEKAKLASLANNGGNSEKISAKDLMTAANIMKPHFDLMEEKVEVERESLDSYFKRILREAAQSPEAPVNGSKKHQQIQA